MKVIVMDARMVGAQGHGIARYVEEIAESLRAGGEFRDYFLKSLDVSDWSRVRPVFLIRRDCPPDSPVRAFETRVLDLSCYHPVSWVRVPLLLLRSGAAFYFNPTFASFPWLPCPFIQTIHDLNHLRFGTWPQKVYYQTLVRWSCLRAERLLTVSRFILGEIESWIRVPPGKLSVIYNPVDPPQMLDDAEIDLALNGVQLARRGFFLSVLNSKPHKNSLLLLEAYRNYRESIGSRKPLPLVVNLASSEVPDHLREGVLALGSISSRTLSALYRGTSGFFFPSLYEGFGRPPVEAALAGARVFASDIPPHREGAVVFGVKMEFLDPQDPLAWVRAFEESGI
jgi:glycosyltransferase involved in cell wall biosynthesis